MKLSDRESLRNNEGENTQELKYVPSLSKHIASDRFEVLTEEHGN